MNTRKALPAFALALLGSIALAGTTTFDGDTGGWGVYGSNEGGVGDFLLSSGGNPGGTLQFLMVDTFGVALKNTTDASILGDLTRYDTPIDIGIDVRADSITYLGNEVSRRVVVEFVSYNAEGSEYPYTSVWKDLGAISAAQNGWQSLGTAIADTKATALPAGWGGYGAEDPVTYEPILPAGRTFASVLADVDEVRFTTFVPGYFYGFTNYDLRYDNVKINAAPVPEPATMAALGLGAAALLRRRRRK